MDIVQQRGQVFWWSIFDFANSIVFINLGLYFSQWLVVDKGISAFWFNFVDVAVTIILIMTMPALGVISDRTNKRVLFLKLTAIPIAFFTFLIGFSGQILTGFSPIIIGFFSFLFVVYFYQLSLVFYHAMLGNLAKREKYGTISGVGLAAGWIGAIVGLLVILPFVTGKITFLPSGERIHAFIPAAVIFTVFVTIALKFLKDPEKTSRKTKKPSIKQAYIKLFEDFKGIRKNPQILYFLLAYWLLIDAVLTIQDNSPLYLEIVLNLPDQQKVVVGALILLMAAVGALIFGRMGDRVGYKKALTTITISWVVVLIGFLQIESWGLSLIIVVSLLGILFGGTWTITRALYTAIIPPTQRGEYFGFYASAERFGSIIGPLIWSVFVVGLQSFGPFRYKAAVVSMILLIVVSLVFLRKLQLSSENDRHEPSGGSR